MYGCELDDDSTRGHLQYGYDGEDFISFDKDTLTNIAASPQAFITKTKWDEDKANNEYQKSYLETECIEWLKKYVGYGKDTLERKGRNFSFYFGGTETNILLNLLHTSHLLAV